MRSRSTVGEFLERYSSADWPDRVLVHATRPKLDGLESHTFALDRGWFFDNNTPDGKPVKVGHAPRSIFDMRIVDVYFVRLRPGRRKKNA
jgi:hypothetical protein